MGCLVGLMVGSLVWLATLDSLSVIKISCEILLVLEAYSFFFFPGASESYYSSYSEAPKKKTHAVLVKLMIVLNYDRYSFFFSTIPALWFP